VVYRFVGITPSSSSARTLMRSVYAQVQGRVEGDRGSRGKERGNEREIKRREIRRDFLAHYLQHPRLPKCLLCIKMNQTRMKSQQKRKRRKMTTTATTMNLTFMTLLLSLGIPAPLLPLLFPSCFDANPPVYRFIVKYFPQLLTKVRRSRPVYIFLDSLDQLSDEDAGRSLRLSLLLSPLISLSPSPSLHLFLLATLPHMLFFNNIFFRWLPCVLPPNVHLVVSVLPSLIDNVKAQHKGGEECYTFVPRMSVNDGLPVSIFIYLFIYSC
jgi:hypothetical protein